MRLFLDANVIFTAAYSEAGNARALFRLADAGRCTVASSEHAIAEARKNIVLKAPDVSDALADLVLRIEVVPEADCRFVVCAESLGLPPNDAPILAAAVAGRADALVTGDRRHFGALFGTRQAGELVLSPATALGVVLDEGGPSPV